MNKRYKVAVSDTVPVTIKVTIADKSGKPVAHKFTLICERRSAEELKAQLEGNFNAKDFMKEVTTGWEGQRLVLEQDNSPAEFNTEALDELLNIGGLAMICFVAYGKDATAQAKN